MTDKPDDKDLDKPKDELSLDDLIAEAQGKKPEKPGEDKTAPDKPTAPTPTPADKPAPPSPPPVKDETPPKPPAADKPKDAGPPKPPAVDKPKGDGPPPPPPPPPPPKMEGPPPKTEAKPEAPSLPKREETPPAKPTPPPKLDDKPPVQPSPLPKREETPPISPAGPPPPPPPEQKPPLPKREEAAEPIGPTPRAEKKAEPTPAREKLPAIVSGPAHLVLLAAAWFLMVVGLWSNWTLVSNPWLKIGLVVAPAVALVASILLWRSTAWTFKTGLSCLMAVLIGLALWAAPLEWWKDPNQVFNLLGYQASIIILIMLLALAVATLVLWWRVFKRFKIVAAVLTVISLYALYPLVYALGQEMTLTQVFGQSAWMLDWVPWWIDPLYVLFEVVFPLALVLALVTYFIRLFQSRKAQVYLWTFLIFAAASATGFAFLNTVPRQGKVLPHLLSHSSVSQHLKIPSLDDQHQAVKRQVADMTSGFFFVRGLDRTAGDAVRKLDQTMKDAAARRKRELMDINKRIQQIEQQKKRLEDRKKSLQQEGTGVRPPGGG
jgi:hypothetical protein